MSQVSFKLLKEIDRCKECKSINDYNKFPIKVHLEMDSNIMLIAESPGRDSTKKEKYWTGEVGSFLRSALNNKGVALEDLFYLTDIIKCCPNNRKTLKKHAHKCIHFLKEEICQIKPKLILILGEIASTGLLGKKIKLKNDHGKLFYYNEIPTLILYHPGYIFKYKNTSLKAFYLKQMQELFLAIIQKKTKDIEKIFIQKELVKDKIKFKKQPQPIEIWNNSPIFVLPSSGNKITKLDIKKYQLRITTSFKKYFPKESCNIRMIINNTSYIVPFRFRINKSHLVYLGKQAMIKLGLKEVVREKVKFTKLNNYTFKLERLS